jgi:HEAT repeat protein/tetratricopeptide (TPR) repeat protein
MKRAFLLAVLAALLPASRASSEADGPLYRLPPGFSPPSSRDFDDPEGLVERSIRAIVERASVWERTTARRTLGAVGDPGLPAIVDALGSAGRRARRDLIAAVAEMTEPASFGLLVAAARDPSWAVREKAAFGLGIRRRAEALAPLVPLLEDPVWKVRQSTITALRRLAATVPGVETGPVLDLLAARLVDRDREVRRTAAWALLRHGHEASLPRAFAVLWTGPRKSRPEAIRALPVIESPPVLGILEQVMREPDAVLAFTAAERYAAIRGLAVLEIPGMRVRLRDELLKPTGPIEPAIGVVRRLRADALPFLRETLERRGRDLTRYRPGAGDRSTKARRILNLMASVAGPDAVPEFRRIIDEAVESAHDSHLLSQAIEVGRLSFPKALEESFRRCYVERKGIFFSTQAKLLKALASTDPAGTAPLLAEAAASATLDLHYAVLDVVNSLGPRCDRKGLLEAVLRSSRNSGLLEKALPQAGQILGEEIEHLILPRLADPDLRIRRAAVDALTSRKSPENAARLKSLFRETAPEEDDEADTKQRKDELRKAIVTSLPFVDPEPDLGFLREALRAEEFTVRESAGRTLGRHPGEATAAAVLEALDREEDPSVRKALIRALAGCPGDDARTRIEQILADGRRADRIGVLSALATAKTPIPDVIREGACGEAWDANLRSLAATVMARRGDSADLDRLVETLTAGAPPEMEQVVLKELGDRRAVAQIPGLIALLPEGPLDEVDPGRGEFLLALVECLGKIGDPRAAGALQSLMAAARTAVAGSPGEVGGMSEDLLGMVAPALSRVDPEAALPDMLGLVLDPAMARLHWERGVVLSKESVKMLPPVRGACAGLQRVPDEALQKAVADALAAERRSGRLIELPQEYVWRVAEELASKSLRRPRKAAAARVREALVALPPRVTRLSCEAAEDVATRNAFFGTAAEMEEAAAHAGFLLDLDPGTGKSPADRRRTRDLLRALETAGRGARAGEAGDAAASVRLFDEAAGIDTAHTNIAWYLGWCGHLRGLPFEKVKEWTARAAALSANEPEASRWHVLDLVGVVLRRDGKPEQAEHYLEQALGPSLLKKSGLVALHLAIVRIDLEQLEDAEKPLLKACETDDNFWVAARSDPRLAPLRENGAVDRILEEARKVFD